MKMFLMGLLVISVIPSFASECANYQVKKLTTTMLNHYRIENNLSTVSQDELFTIREMYSGHILSERKVSFETVGELEDYLYESKFVQEVDQLLEAPLNSFNSIIWTLRSSLANKNGIKKSYMRSARLDDIFDCR